MIFGHWRSYSSRLETLDRDSNPTLSIIPRKYLSFFSACPHRQFQMIPSTLHSQVALPNSSLTPVCQAGMQFRPFYNGLWYDPAKVQTNNPSEVS